MEDFLTIEELSQRLKVKKSWIYGKTMRRGDDALPRYKIGNKHLRFLESEVREWMKQFREGMKPTAQAA